jgi:SH3-like domain-containing protein
MFERRLMKKTWLSCVRGAACAIGFIAVVGLPLDVGALAASPGEAGARANPSGLPIPRFVSLKASRVNVRIGPGEDYKIAWVFTRPGLPIEIIQEFDNWRRIRDSDGTVGWVFRSLLSGKRTAVVTPWSSSGAKAIHAAASPEAAVTAYLQPGVMAEIDRCDEGWCRLSGDNFDGWIAQDQLWGVYPDEEVD